MGGLNESFRQQLENVLLGWQRSTANCLMAAVEAGELSSVADVNQLAAFFWIGWEGAILRAKLTRSAEPMSLFGELFFVLVGKSGDATSPGSGMGHSA